jgi:hypothetical protein
MMDKPEPMDLAALGLDDDDLEEDEDVEAEPQPLELSEIDPKLHKHVDPSGPPPVRMMAARAMVPMGPRDMVFVVYQLQFDPDEKIGKMARTTMAGFDDRILGAVVADAKIPPGILDALCRNHMANVDMMEKLLTNRSTPDSAFVFCGRNASEQKVLHLIAANQERTLRTHDIVRALRENPQTLRSDLDRAIDFLVREGVFLQDVPEFEESFLRLGKAEMLEALKDVELPAEVLADDGEDAEAAQDDLIQAAEEAGHDKTWAEMTFAEKAAVAMRGKRMFALLAIDSPNRILAKAGIQNERITENDVQKIVKKRSMHEEVIKEICRNGDWTKAYAVKFALVQHPKTPARFVMQWINLLRVNDLRTLSKSKQIPSNVSMQAKRILQNKGGR